MLTLEHITNEIATGIISYEMKFNIKKEFDDELKHVKGLMNESYNTFLIPMLNEVKNTLVALLDA